MESRSLLKPLALLAVLALILAVPFYADAQVPFGGYITVVTPICQTPPAVWLKTTAGPFMYTSGTVSFIAGPPRHPGQGLLGLFSGYIPCIIWGCCPPFPIKIGGGPLIILHGSSY
ncbi:MAG: hypothetical protein Greene041679_92 [Parcubacteria group bacterium Greene0416_79]|nr:MAG: hypothetical protein Greene041679_92 [Parcubacteria group bacterium Greene0416_79]